MKLIVGLGNPGIEYQSTPHNLGFEVVDCIATSASTEIRNWQCQALTARMQIGSETVLLAKPGTFMNLSGNAVKELAGTYEVDVEKDLVVIYDELDLPLGQIRIRERGSSAGHNGMKSIIGSLGTQEFLRIRLGIAPEKKILKPFRKSQRKEVDQMIANAADAVEVILKEGRAAAMNRFNRKAEEPEE